MLLLCATSPPPTPPLLTVATAAGLAPLACPPRQLGCCRLGAAWVERHSPSPFTLAVWWRWMSRQHSFDRPGRYRLVTAPINTARQSHSRATDAAASPPVASPYPVPYLPSFLSQRHGELEFERPREGAQADTVTVSVDAAANRANVEFHVAPLDQLGAVVRSAAPPPPMPSRGHSPPFGRIIHGICVWCV